MTTKPFVKHGMAQLRNRWRHGGNGSGRRYHLGGLLYCWTQLPLMNARVTLKQQMIAQGHVTATSIPHYVTWLVTQLICSRRCSQTSIGASNSSPCNRYLCTLSVYIGIGSSNSSPCNRYLCTQCVHRYRFLKQFPLQPTLVIPALHRCKT
jgi:hypothetical protein